MHYTPRVDKIKVKIVESYTHPSTVQTTAPVGVSPFDAIRKTRPDRSEYWSARDLLMGFPGLGYGRWENAEQAVQRAMKACKNSGQQPDNHFREVTKMVGIGSGAKRPVSDYELSRYACYLVAMNGDPDKTEIAAAQSYFAIQTRRAEQELPPLPNASQSSVRHITFRVEDTWLNHKRLVYKKHGYGAWSIWTQSPLDLLKIESVWIDHRFDVRCNDMPDISIGMMWAKYLRSIGIDVNWPHDCALVLPKTDKRQEAKDVFPSIFPCKMLESYQDWLYNTYLTTHLHSYYYRKFFEELGLRQPVAIGSAAEHTCQSIAGKPASLAPEIRQQLIAAGGIVRLNDLPALPDRRQKTKPAPAHGMKQQELPF